MLDLETSQYLTLHDIINITENPDNIVHVTSWKGS